MKKSRSTEQQIAFALQQAGSRTAIAEICRKLGISEQTYSLLSKLADFRWASTRG